MTPGKIYPDGIKCLSVVGLGLNVIYLGIYIYRQRRLSDHPTASDRTNLAEKQTIVLAG